MNKSNFTPRRIAMSAILIAIFFALSLLSFEIGGVKITLDSLPVVVAALLGGPINGFLVGILGELLAQALRYGFTATTALWILPPALRGLLIGLGCVAFRRQMQISAIVKEKRPFVYFIVCIVAAVFTSLGNTLVYYLDSKIYGYYNYALIFGVAGIRVLTNVLASVITAAIAIPVVLALRKAALLKETDQDERS